MSTVSVSPSRNYVAVCPKGNFDGHYFRSFFLPEKDGSTGEVYENNSSIALWFFMNRLNFTAMMEICVTLEDFRDVSQQVQDADGSSRMFDFPNDGKPYLAARVFRGGEATVGLTKSGALVRRDEDKVGFRFFVGYGADGTVVARVVGPTRNEDQYAISRSKNPKRLKWTFNVAKANVVVAMEDGTVTVTHTVESQGGAAS